MTGTWLLMPFTQGNPISPGVLIYQLYLLVLSSLYYVGFWVYCGQTVGMRAWRIQVETVEGKPLSWQQGIKRMLYAVLTLAPFGLGLWYVIFNPSRQTLYDQLAGTRVLFLKK